MYADLATKARQQRVTALEKLAFRRQVQTNVLPLNHALAQSARIRAALSEQAACIAAAAMAEAGQGVRKRARQAAK